MTAMDDERWKMPPGSGQRLAAIAHLLPPADVDEDQGDDEEDRHAVNLARWEANHRDA